MIDRYTAARVASTTSTADSRFSVSSAPSAPTTIGGTEAARNRPVTAAHGDDDDEDDVGRGRLDEDDAGERKAEYDRRVEASDRERDDREERRTSGKLRAERSLGAGEPETDRKRQRTRRDSNQHELRRSTRGPVPRRVSENLGHARCRDGRRV